MKIQHSPFWLGQLRIPATVSEVDILTQNKSSDFACCLSNQAGWYLSLKKLVQHRLSTAINWHPHFGFMTCQTKLNKYETSWCHFKLSRYRIVVSRSVPQTVGQSVLWPLKWTLSLYNSVVYNNSRQTGRLKMPW